MLYARAATIGNNRQNCAVSTFWWRCSHALDPWYQWGELRIGSGRRIYLYGRDKYRRLNRTQNVNWSAWAYTERSKTYQDRRHRKHIVIESVVIGFESWMSLCRTCLINRQLRRKYIMNQSCFNRIYSVSSMTTAQSECRNGTFLPIIADCCHSSVGSQIAEVGMVGNRSQPSGVGAESSKHGCWWWPVASLVLGHICSHNQECQMNYIILNP